MGLDELREKSQIIKDFLDDHPKTKAAYEAEVKQKHNGVPF